MPGLLINLAVRIQAMAAFVGTNKEFRKYIGPRLRNLVRQITQKYKKEVGTCQHCDTKADLQAAHVHGRGRNEAPVNQDIPITLDPPDPENFKKNCFLHGRQPLKQHIRMAVKNKDPGMLTNLKKVQMYLVICVLVKNSDMVTGKQEALPVFM